MMRGFQNRGGENPPLRRSAFKTGAGKTRPYDAQILKPGQGQPAPTTLGFQNRGGENPPLHCMAYDPEIHHRKSIRLRGYDYSAPGRYFVTICAQEKACLFGGIASGQIELNDYGRIVESLWKELPQHFPLIELDRFIVMPNHFHAIVVIVDPRAKRVGAGFPRPDSETSETGVGAVFPRPDSETSEIDKGAGFPRPMSPILNPGGENPPLRTLGDVIRWFKYESTKRINELRDMAGRRIWQRNYYEHVILSDKSYWRIREYIADNPKNWVKDKLHPGSDWQTNHLRGNIE